jgi:hypothetical protein
MTRSARAVEARTARRRRVARRRGGSGVAIFPRPDRVRDWLRDEMWEETRGRTGQSVLFVVVIPKRPHHALRGHPDQRLHRRGRARALLRRPCCWPRRARRRPRARAPPPRGTLTSLSRAFTCRHRPLLFGFHALPSPLIPSQLSFSSLLRSAKHQL